MTPQRFLAATAALDWGTLDDIQAHLARCGYWEGVQADRATQVLHVQEMLALTNEEDWPLFGMMERPDGQCIWKQEAAFTPEDYKAVGDYWAHRAAYAQQMAQAMITAYRHGN